MDKKNIDLKKDPAGGINPRTASMASDRYGVEVYPEARKPLDHPPTPEDFKAYAQEHAGVLAKHPELRVGWDTTGDVPELNIGMSSNNLEAVKKVGAALDQRSVWDTIDKKEIFTGGKNTQREFKDYPLEQRVADLRGKPLGNLAATADRISTRVPTAKKATEDVMAAEPLTVGLDAVRQAPGLMEKLANEVRDYPGGKIPANIKDPEKVVTRFTDRAADNLKWLYNQVPKATQEQTRKWYESANKLANGIAAKHGLSESQAAGVIAALSPQKPWDMNVSLARRVVDVYHNEADSVMTPEMMATGVKITTDPKTAGTNENLAAVLKDLDGKKLSELSDPYQRAAWIRLFDETYNPRGFHRIDPGTGENRETMTNDNGKPSEAAWGSLNQIAKTLSIMDNGSRENVSKEMGMAHKVRNFYNNIVDPSNDKDVTIDTHAVAAALLRPLAGNDKPVTKNFGGISASGVGSKGTYPLYAEAYRKAAADLGIKPRELQSVVWEKVREMFTDTFKNKANKTAVDNLWKQYDDKKMSLDQVRSAILDMTEQAKAKSAKGKKPGTISALDFLGLR